MKGLNRLLVLLVGLAMLTGCGGTMSIKYSPAGFYQPVIDKNQSELSIYIPPFKDNRSSDTVFWNGGGTNRPPTEILREALLMELQRLGVKLARSLQKSQGYIQGTLTSFNVADNFLVLVGDVKFSLELFKVDGNLSVWKHEFQGKASGSPTGSNPISSTLSTALNNSLNRLAYSEGFTEVMASLAIQTRGKIPQPPSQPVVPRPSIKQQAVSGGTGFLFSSKDYVVTNYHVVKGANSIIAKFTSGQKVEAVVVAKDPKNDIAILKLAQAPSLSAAPIKLGDSSFARMGEKIFTIGYPASKIMGEKPKYSEGVINALTGLKDDPAFFQISVPVQPGNSGGPLFNERGEVIGITTASLSLLAIEAMGAIPQNVNYAIKSSFVKNLLSTIPELMLSNTGIVVVPNEPEKSLPNFIEQVSKNIVLIEAKE